jgi:hypothetical protein
MKTQRSLILATLATVAAATACAKPAVTMNPGAVDISRRWNASLVTPANLTGALQIKGTAYMAPGRDTLHPATTAGVQISNAAPKGVHPWRVHRGQCGSDQGVVGTEDIYKNLVVKDDGTASQTATLPMPMPTSGEFFAAVHAAPTNMDVVVACGNLAPPTQ